MVLVPFLFYPSIKENTDQDLAVRIISMGMFEILSE